MLNESTPHTGSLLLSEPFMIDPNFKRSVVLLADHNEEGTIGYILNQKSDFLLRDLIADCWDSLFPVYLGGPVGNDTLHFIHRCPEKMNSGTEIGNGIYWGGNFETLKVLINNSEIDDTEVRFFLGYSGWQPDQLNFELLQNSWLVVNEFKGNPLFTHDFDDLWKDIIISLGPRYSHLVNFPENPQWN